MVVASCCISVRVVSDNGRTVAALGLEVCADAAIASARGSTRSSFFISPPKSLFRGILARVGHLQSAEGVQDGFDGRAVALVDADVSKTRHCVDIHYKGRRTRDIECIQADAVVHAVRPGDRAV